MLLRIGAFLLCLLSVAARAEPITVCAVGDINMGTAFPSEEYLPPDGGAGLFPPVKDLFSGDVIFGNLEGPLADEGKTDKCSSPRGCYAFRTPTSYVKHLTDTGFNVLSVANNHAMDFGEEGRQSTLKVLKEVGIAYSGPVGEVAELEVRGKKIALVAFSTADHSYNLLDIEKAVEVVSELDKKHDLVLVSFHGGSEGSRAAHVPDEMEHLGSEPRGHLIKFTHALVDAGADLVIGHGPHLLRGMEVYRRRLIAYSLGNFCTYARFNLSGALGRAVVLNVELDPDTGEFVGGRLHPTFQEKPGGPKPDPSGQGIKLIARLSREDFKFSAPSIGDDGRLLPPPGDTAGLFTLKDPQERKELRQLMTKLAGAGLDQGKLQTWFGDKRAALIPEVVERMKRPAEKMPYKKYRAIFIKKDVLEGGKKFLEEKEKLLAAVEEKYQVDRQALCGLIATETRFGVHKGKYLTFNALATLAMKYTRRSRWARGELKALVKVFEEDPLAIKGSYAGAVGLVQFMPTSIRRFGVDFDQDGKIDLDQWNDALASAANYLKKHGWKRGLPIQKGSANYRALHRYNPAHNYVRVIAELSKAFGYRKEAEEKKNETPKKKKAPEKKKTP
jgi:membrane-bound lytic murein transglycosylase B